MDVYTSVNPSQIEEGGSGTLIITISEVGGEDWAKDVIVKPYSIPGITISPSKSSPVNIDKYGSATFTFRINVDKRVPAGKKTLYFEVYYKDTGWMNIGEFSHSKIFDTTFEVIPSNKTLKYSGIKGSYVKSNPSGEEIYTDKDYKGTTSKTISKKYPETHNVKTKSPKSLIAADLISIIYYGINDIKRIDDSTLMILLFLGLITVGGGIYFITKKKRQNKIDKPATVKTSYKTEKHIPDFPAELLNKYIPLEKLGEGGFGKVFKVKRKGGTKPIAIKVPNVDEKAEKYLLKEINAWKNLDHPNIVKMYDAYEEPIPHIEMEYIDGYNLNGELIKDLDKYPKPVNPKEAVKLIKQIAEGLKHAHDKNIIHRDIKPSNILLTSNLIPKITDWGLAKIGAKSSTATTTKALTLLYSAPEQIDEEEYGKTDKRTDIYQLGLLFYELLTGRLPYEGTSPTQISLKIVNPDKKPLPPSTINPELSIFDGIFEKLLAKRKEDRFQSIDEFLEALNSLEKLNKEKEELKKTLVKTTELIKKSTDKSELNRLTKELIDSTTKLALNCAKANDKVGLLDALESLKDYIKSEENKRELNGAINEMEYRIKESIPLGKDTIEKLEVLLNRIKREWK